MDCEISTFTWTVYMHILKKDPTKLYVGITGRKPELRWKKNGAGYGGNTYFHNAIAKYGFDAFDHIIYVQGLTKFEAECMEQALIEVLPKFGYHLYNICSGGRCNDGRKGHKNSIAHNNRISECNKGRPQTLEQREASRQRCLDRKSGWFSKPGAKCPFKHYYGKDNPRARKVYVFSLNGTYLDCFDTIREASKVYNVPEAYISTCCRGRIHKTHGYRFSYTEVL